MGKNTGCFFLLFLLIFSTEMKKDLQPIKAKLFFKEIFNVRKLIVAWAIFFFILVPKIGYEQFEMKLVEWNNHPACIQRKIPIPDVE